MTKTNVRHWWFKPGYNLVHLVRNINEPWNADNGGPVCPEALRKKYPRTSLLTFGEEPAVNGWIPIYFSNPDGLKEHAMQQYWVAPGLLVEEPCSTP